MKFQILTLAITAVAAVANAAESTTTTEKIKPTAVIPNPPGLVCPMTVCPSASAALSKREIACPATCPNDCEVVDDHCCPGQKKAVCKAGSSAVSGSASATVSASSTSAPVITPAPSASSSVSPAAASSPKPSAASHLNTASILSTFMLAALLTVGLNQL